MDLAAQHANFMGKLQLELIQNINCQKDLNKIKRFYPKNQKFFNIYFFLIKKKLCF